MKGSIGLTSWLVIVLIGSLWILPELSEASPVPAEEQSETSSTSRPFFGGLRSGFDRMGAGIRSSASSVKEMMVREYEKIKEGVAAIGGRFAEDKTEGPVTRKNESASEDGQFVFPADVETSEVAFAEERLEMDAHTSLPDTTTTTTTATTTTISRKNDNTTKSPTGSVPDVNPDRVVETSSTDGPSLEDRSLFDVPEKSKCDNDKQRTAKDGSCRTAIKQ